MTVAGCALHALLLLDLRNSALPLSYLCMHSKSCRHNALLLAELRTMHSSKEHGEFTRVHCTAGVAHLLALLQCLTHAALRPTVRSMETQLSHQQKLAATDITAATAGYAAAEVS